MLSRTFHNLSEQRQREILQVCLEIFASEGFDAASTNQMVSRLGIAKGTLFKYAPSKKALFLHLFEAVTIELAEIQDSPAIYRSADLFVRVEDLFEAFLAYAEAHPVRYQFALRATVDTSSSIYPEVEQIRLRISRKYLTAIFDGVDWTLYCHPREEVVEIFTWILSGSRSAAITVLGRDSSMEAYVRQIRNQISVLRKLLRKGIYRPEEDRP